MNIEPVNVTLPITFPRWERREYHDVFVGLETGEIPCKATYANDRVVILNDKGNVMADISKSLFNTLWYKNLINQDTYA